MYIIGTFLSLEFHEILYRNMSVSLHLSIFPNIRRMKISCQPNMGHSTYDPRCALCRGAVGKGTIALNFVNELRPKHGFRLPDTFEEENRIFMDFNNS